MNSHEKNSTFSTLLLLVFRFPPNTWQIIFVFCHHDSDYVLCYSLLMQEIDSSNKCQLNPAAITASAPELFGIQTFLSRLTPNFHVNKMHKMTQRHLWPIHSISLHVVANSVPRWHHESRPNVAVWGAMSRVRLF